MGGLKRKIPMEKIEKKQSRSVAFTKRREGLYRKASELCLLFDAHIAILATPPSTNSTVSFYSFGHSSVENVADAFLENRSPTVDNNHCCLAGKKRGLGLGFRWEEEGFDRSEDPEDLMDAIDEILKLKNGVKLRLDATKDRRPHVAEELQDFCNNDRRDTTGDFVTNLQPLLDVPQDSNQTDKTSNDYDSMLKSEDFSLKNPVSHYKDCRDEEARAIEAGLLFDKEFEDSLDDINFDDFLRNFSIDAAQSLPSY